MIEICMFLLMMAVIVMNFYVYRLAKNFYHYSLYVLNEWTAYTIKQIREELSHAESRKEK